MRSNEDTTRIRVTLGSHGGPRSEKEIPFRHGYEGRAKFLSRVGLILKGLLNLETMGHMARSLLH